MKKNYFLLTLILTAFSWQGNAQSITQSLTSGIDTDKGFTGLSSTSSCPGILSFTIPTGDIIDSVSTSYDMSAVGGGWMSEQRSWLYSPTVSAGESTVFSGSGNSNGTVTYNRTGISFANAASGTVDFALHAGRTYGGSGCNSTYNKVDAGTWSVTVYYSVAPSCPVPTALAATNITATSADLGWTSAGALWDIELGTAGFTPTGIPTTAGTATNPYNATGLTPVTSYDFYVRNDCGGGDLSTWAGPFSFTTACPAFLSAPFAESFDATTLPSCWSQSATTGGPWVFGNTGIFWNTSGCPAPTDHTSNGGNMASMDHSSTDVGVILEMPVIDVSSLTIPNLDFWYYMCNTGYSPINELYIEAWDGSAWTLVDSNTIGTSGWEKLSYNLSTFTYGANLVKVRFRSESGGAGVDFYGDAGIDDVRIDEEPSCPTPTALTATNITTTSADLGWTSAGSLWDIELGTAGFTPTGTPTTAGTTNPYNATALNAAISYDFYVRNNCGASGISTWAGPFSFTTACPAFLSAPFAESFDATTLPNCWSQSSTTGGPWVFGNTGIFWNTSGCPAPTDHTSNGGNMASLDHSSTDVGVILEMPVIDVSSLTIPNLDFWYYMCNTGYSPINELYIEAWDGSAWTLVDSNTIGTSGWEKLSYNLSTFTYGANLVKVRFRSESGGASADYYGDAGIDDVSIDEQPTCFSPTMANATVINNTSAIANWSAPLLGTPTSYIVKYGTAGFNPLVSGTTIVSSTLTSTISGLTAETSYEYYVRTYCGGTDSSSWTSPVSFTTKCSAYTPTYSEDFTAYLTGCWEEANGVLGVTSNVVIGSSDWKSDGFANVGFSGAASMNIWSTGKNDWLISAPIDLGTGAIPYQVEYDVALTNYSSTAPDAMGSDDTLALVISTDFGLTWSSANILRNYVSGDEPSNAGNREFIDLSSYSGIVQFGFYAASSVSNADYDVHLDNFLVTNLCVPSSQSYNDTACGTYTSPSGKVWTMAGTYNDTLQKTRGCDSIFVITLVVNNTTASISPTVCDSYIAPSGVTYTTSGMYMDTIANSIGCDSIISINLTVNYSISITNTLTVCDSYTRPGGTVANYSNTYYDTIQTVLGCDSMITTVLTVNYSTYSTINPVACGTYTSPSGKVWTSSALRRDTIMNSMGCDSLMTINLTIKPVTSETRTISSCFSYTVPETGSVYNTSGTYTDVSTNAFGCSHTITTVLTINIANAGTISVSGITMTSSATGVSYKWVDCDNNYSFLLKDTLQSYTPPRNGNYSCWITTLAGCSDTTAPCVSIESVSLEEYVVTSSDISIFPNPANDFVTIDILNQNDDEDVEIRLFDTKGKLVYSRNVSSKNNKVTFDVSKLAEGVYTVTVFNEFFSTSKKVIVVK